MRFMHRGVQLIPGNDLLSHPPTRAVPSAVAGLTSVFGMGTGVTLLLWPPGNCFTLVRRSCSVRSENVLRTIVERSLNGRRTFVEPRDSWCLGSLPSASYAAPKEGRPRAFQKALNIP